MTDQVNPDWNTQTAEMDRLCRLHLDKPYSAVQVQSHYVLVKLAPNSNELPLKRIGSGLLMPDTDKINQIFCGLVVGMGPYAYTDGVATKWTNGPLCKLGDYIVFFQAESTQTLINNYRVAYVRDHLVLGVTDEPEIYGTYVTGRFRSMDTKPKSIFSRKRLNALGFDCEDPRVAMLEDFN